LAVIRNAMTLERDKGMGMQNLFTMFQRGNYLPSGYRLGHNGIFADMTTAQTQPRPVALAAKLLNQAQGEILATSVSGGWTVDSGSTIDEARTVAAGDAMVSFDGKQLVVTLFNNTVAGDENADFHFTLPGVIDGQAVGWDWAKATFSVLNGPGVEANNETGVHVEIAPGAFTRNGSQVYAALPGHAMGSFVIPVA